MALKYRNSAPVLKEFFLKSSKILFPYIDRLKMVSKNKSYDFLESSICLPYDDYLLENVLKVFKEKGNPKLKYIINIGIGGSNLGSKAVYDALFGYFDTIEPNRFPKMIFSDTNDPEFLQRLSNFLEKEIKNMEEIIICMISKSGTTTETTANFEITYKVLQKRFQNIGKRLVVITDFASKLWVASQKNNISLLSIPKNVGGRYSIFSSVGLFPLLANGIDIKAFRNGAQKMREKCLSENKEENLAFNSATTLFYYYKKGININDNFFFHPELESVGKWYRQLMGESIGKEKDLDGKTVNAGLTPTVSIGSTDLHSVGQLYLGGPKDKITTFVYAQNPSKNIKISDTLFLEDLVENIKGKNPQEIMNAILEGTKIAYTKRGLPFTEVILEDISGESLGAFFQFKMMEIMLLAKLMNVNSFDQPNVELYKVETKKILSS